MPDREDRKRNASDAGDGSALDDEVAVQDRFNEAHQGMMGLLFAAFQLRGRELRARRRSLPLTIIGGFLGSGKTTLLNHLLASPHGRRLVVLVNDFGRINIDAALIASQTDDMINLTNGCACCAVSADLTNNLIEIAEREDPPDAIVLEASGVADPNGIVHVALANPSIRLDGSLVVVDTETLPDLADDAFTERLFHNQISAADLVVLSKVDLVGEAQRREARAWLAAHHPDKRVVEAVRGDVPADVVLGIDTRRDVQTVASPPPDHAHDFESVGFTVDAPLDGERLQKFFDGLPDSLLRAKGVLCLAEEPEHRTIFQRVGRRWSYTPAASWGDEPPHSSLILIGPKGCLDRAALAEGLDACRATGAEES